MKEDWMTATLGSVCDIQSGAGFPEDLQGGIGEKYPFYKVSDMNLPGNETAMVSANNSISESVRKQLRARTFPPDSILFPKVGGAIYTNKKRVTSVDCCVDNNIMGLIPNTDLVQPGFLFYYMHLVDIVEFSNKANPPSIRQSTVEAWPIYLPKAISEQKRIVANLDEVFEGIGVAVANARKNLANARELFENYLNSIFAQTGSGWTQKNLGEIATFKNGLNYTKGSKGETIKIVGVRDFQKNYSVPTDQLETAQINGKLSADYELRIGDILTVRSNGNKQLIGRCILAGDVPEKTSHSGFTIRIRVASKDVSPAFLVRFLKAKTSREMLIESGDGANISSLNQQALSTLPVSLPSFSEQLAITARIEAVAAETKNLEAVYQQKLAALSELKQAILKRAFSGELTGSTAETMPEAAE